jgi:hypothetical protein
MSTPTKPQAISYASYEGWWNLKETREPTQSEVDAVALRLADLLEETAREALEGRGHQGMLKRWTDVVGESWPASFAEDVLCRGLQEPSARARMKRALAVLKQALDEGYRFHEYDAPGYSDITFCYQGLLPWLNRLD